MQITQLFDNAAAHAVEVVDKLNADRSMTEVQYAEAITRTGEVIIMAALREIAETDPAEADRLMRAMHTAMQAEEAGAQ